MKRIIGLILSFSAVQTSATEVRFQNALKLGWARIFDARGYEQLKYTDSIVRAPRVPLIDVRACKGEPIHCVIVNGQKIELEAHPEDHFHERLHVIGRARGTAQTGLFLKVRFSPWSVSEPDYLYVWASIRNRDQTVTIRGYSVGRDDDISADGTAGVRIGDYALAKYLTSRNVLEVEIARELVYRHLFCVKFRANALDTLHDELSMLHNYASISTPGARARLNYLQTAVGAIDQTRGAQLCDGPMTDQVDGLLSEVRDTLQNVVRPRAKARVQTPKRDTPATPVKPPVPTPAAPAS